MFVKMCKAHYVTNMDILVSSGIPIVNLVLCKNYILATLIVVFLVCVNNALLQRTFVHNNGSI